MRYDEWGKNLRVAIDKKCSFMRFRIFCKIITQHHLVFKFTSANNGIWWVMRKWILFVVEHFTIKSKQTTGNNNSWLVLGTYFALICNIKRSQNSDEVRAWLLLSIDFSVAVTGCSQIIAYISIDCCHKRCCCCCLLCCCCFVNLVAVAAILVFIDQSGKLAAPLVWRSLAVKEAWRRKKFR